MSGHPPSVIRHPFLKMNGAGNDFVVFDARTQRVALSPEQIRAIASRSNSVTKGCDQIIVMELPSSDLRHPSSVFMRIYNADGGEVDACGNATRCIGWLMMKESGAAEAKVQTKADLLTCRHIPDASAWPEADAAIEADMGEPRFVWDDIPLSMPCKDTSRLELGIAELPDAAGVGMGNPHVIFFTEDTEKLDLIEQIGPRMQQHELFSKQGVNVTIARVLSEKESIQARVWERGVGITAACGTAACATAVAAILRGYMERNREITVIQRVPPPVGGRLGGGRRLAPSHSATVPLPASPLQGEGLLQIRWHSGHYSDPANNRVFLTGPVQTEFAGEVAL